MGMLVDGKWVQDGPDPRYRQGAFVRADTQFRDWITADGSSEHPAEAGRYHLYVSNACPWAHRTLIFRKLKKLDSAISVSYVAPLMLEDGWTLPDGADPVNGLHCMHQVYAAARPDYTGRASVPVLWDKQRRAIVNNESSEIIRMFNDAVGAFDTGGPDFYPADLRDEIDAVNQRIYTTLNNGVYKCGFATGQAAYDETFDALFETLDLLEDRLAGHRYLVGDRITEADWRLFTTLIRFDAVYHGHFKCNRRRIDDYPNLSNYLRDLYQVPGVADTVEFAETKTHYYSSQLRVNPTGIVPQGPSLDFDAPHDRDRFATAAA